MQAGRWDHTAAIAATTLNVNRGKKQPIHAIKLNPFRKKQSTAKRLPKEQAKKLLKSIFLGDHG